MLLGPDDPLPGRPSRITINGTSGAGKSTLARRLSRLLELPYTEMDSLFHGPGWTPNPEFVAVVEECTSGAEWVCEFQYDAARPRLLDRADLMVWLDPHPVRALSRVVRRTVTRRVRREELWNGNREGPLREVVTDPEHVIRYAWSTRRDAARRVEGVLATHPDLPVVRLRTPREVERWLTGRWDARAEQAGSCSCRASQRERR